MAFHQLNPLIDFVAEEHWLQASYVAVQHWLRRCACMHRTSESGPFGRERLYFRAELLSFVARSIAFI